MTQNGSDMSPHNVGKHLTMIQSHIPEDQDSHINTQLRRFFDGLSDSFLIWTEANFHKQYTQHTRRLS